MAASTAACTAAGDTFGSTRRAAANDREDTEILIMVVAPLGVSVPMCSAGYRRNGPERVTFR
jgi:hypothetical protein